ncbi:hypothetical protein [Mycobacterium sp. URHB0021]
MSQVLTNRVGLRGWVSELRAEYRAPDPVGVSFIAHGIIRDVETIGAASAPTRMHVDVWAENKDGVTTSTGRGTVVLDMLSLHAS